MDTKNSPQKTNWLYKVLLLSWSRCNWMTQFSIPIFPVTSNHGASSNCIGCCECSANSCAAIAWWKASCGFVISGWNQLTRATMKFEFTLGCIQNMKVKIKVDVLCIHRMEQLKGKLPLAAGNSHTPSFLYIGEVDVKGKLTVGKVVILCLIWVFQRPSIS